MGAGALLVGERAASGEDLLEDLGALRIVGDGRGRRPGEDEVGVAAVELVDEPPEDADRVLETIPARDLGDELSAAGPGPVRLETAAQAAVAARRGRQDR